jgi:hypothetical protein
MAWPRPPSEPASRAAVIVAGLRPCHLRRESRRCDLGGVRSDARPRGRRASERGARARASPLRGRSRGRGPGDPEQLSRLPDLSARLPKDGTLDQQRHEKETRRGDETVPGPSTPPLSGTRDTRCPNSAYRAELSLPIAARRWPGRRADIEPSQVTGHQLEPVAPGRATSRRPRCLWPICAGSVRLRPCKVLDAPARRRAPARSRLRCVRRCRDAGGVLPARRRIDALRRHGAPHNHPHGPPGPTGRGQRVCDSPEPRSAPGRRADRRPGWALAR